MNCEFDKVSEAEIDAALQSRAAGGWELVSVVINTVETIEGRPAFFLFWKK